MSERKHWAEARSDATSALLAFQRTGRLERAVLIDDIYGRLRVVAWPSTAEPREPLAAELGSVLRNAGGAFWSGDLWVADESAGPADREVYEQAWALGHALDDADRVRRTDRHRTRMAWFERVSEPAWKAVSEGPPVVAFYSVKGGVGRTTALASFALQRAHQGERVCVIDFDLDAPGIGRLLAADDQGTTSPWGTIDFLLERPILELDVTDYVHRCPASLTGEGEILVVPAGRVDDDYLTKLSRVDTDSPPGPEHPLRALLEAIRKTLDPHWILVDVRAGLSPAAGLLLGGFAHLYVLFATTNEQSWMTLRRALARLGSERIHDGRMQADCLLVQAMIPDNAETAALAEATFLARAEEEFAAHYYAEAPDDPATAEQLWTVADLDDTDAPHVPVSLGYRGQLAFFRDLSQIAPLLRSDPAYLALGARIAARFGMEPEV